MRRKARPEAANDGTPERGKDAEKSAETRPGRPPRAKPAVAATVEHNRRTGRACVICNHARRDEFDRMLTVDGSTAAEVARLAGVHRSSAMRHARNHLLPDVAQALREEFDVVAEVRDVYARAQRLLTAAESTNNWPAARAFMGECRSALELLGKLLVAAELSRPKDSLVIEVDVSGPGEYALDVTDAPRNLLGAGEPESPDEETF